MERKTTLQLEAELAKKYAQGTELKKKRRAAAKTAAAKQTAKPEPSEGSTDAESGSNSDGPRPMKAMKAMKVKGGALTAGKGCEKAQLGQRMWR